MINDMSDSQTPAGPIAGTNEQTGPTALVWNQLVGVQHSGI